MKLLRLALATLAAVLLVASPGLVSAQSISAPGFSPPVTADCGLIAVSTPCLALTQTWNGPGVTFTGIDLNITNTSSAAASMPLNLRVGSVSQWNVTVGGVVTQLGDLVIGANGKSLKLGTSADVILTRDGAGALACRNGTNPCSLTLYRSFIDPSNYSGLAISNSSGLFEISTVFAGSGTSGDTVYIGTRGSAPLNFETSNSTKWTITAAGALTTSGAGVMDIGAATSGQARNVTATGYYAGQSPSTQSATTYTVGTTDHALIFTNAGTVTVTLPAAASFPGRMLHLKTTGGGSVISASSNVIPRAGGSAGTAILAAGAGSWADLFSDGTSWTIMAGA